MRRALVVGIDKYVHVESLGAAVADAKAIATRLALNADVDETSNFSVRAIYGESSPVTRAQLRFAVRELFESFEGDALFYFAGHGVLEPTGAFIATSDAVQDDWGIPMQEIVDMGIGSRASSVTILLDCCHSGNLASPAMFRGGSGWAQPLSVLRKNMTVIAASTDVQTAAESGGHGLFTAALLDGLDGAAADLMGSVTTSSLYAHVDRRFGPWQQRPVAKSYVTSPTVVRRCRPSISIAELRRLTEFFQSPNFQMPLEPDHDPDCVADANGNITYKVPVVQEKFDVGQLLKKYRDAGLVRPSRPGEQLFFTAQFRHTVGLTSVGQEYWRLIAARRL